jgi:hypothetical protein
VFNLSVEKQRTFTVARARFVVHNASEIEGKRAELARRFREFGELFATVREKNPQLIKKHQTRLPTILGAVSEAKGSMNQGVIENALKLVEEGLLLLNKPRSAISKPKKMVSISKVRPNELRIRKEMESAEGRAKVEEFAAWLERGLGTRGSSFRAYYLENKSLEVIADTLNTVPHLVRSGLVQSEQKCVDLLEGKELAETVQGENVAYIDRQLAENRDHVLRVAVRLGVLAVNEKVLFNLVYEKGKTFEKILAELRVQPKTLKRALRNMRAKVVRALKAKSN